MRKLLIAMVGILLADCALSADAPVPKKPPDAAVKNLGSDAIEILRAADSMQAYRVGAFQFNGVDDAHVGLRERKGDGKEVSQELRDKIIASLLLESTYTSGSSKGTQVGVAYAIKTIDGRRVEISCCLIKGDFGFVAFDATGKIVKKGSFSGIRNDPKHPFRDLATEAFPNDAEVAQAIKTLMEKAKKQSTLPNQ